MKRFIGVIIFVFCGLMFNTPIISYAEDVYSDWTDKKPEGVTDVQTKTQFRYREKEFTKQVSTKEKEDVENWLCYKSEKQIGEYGAWSAWSTNYVGASEAVAVEQRNVTDVLGFYWNVYHYYHWRNSSGHHYSANYVSGSTYYTFAQKSTDSPQIYYDGSYGGYRLNNNNGGYGCNFDSEVWFRDSSTWNQPVTHNEYRYRERPITYLNYYYRWSEWSSWIDNQVPSFGENRENEFRVMYRYRVTKSNNSNSESKPNQTTTQPTKTSATASSQTKSNTTSKNSNKKKITKAKIKVGGYILKEPLAYKVVSVSGKKGKLELIGVFSSKHSKLKKMRRIVIPKKIKYNGINFVVSIIGKNIIPGAAKKIKIIQIDSTTIKKVKRNNFAKKKVMIVVPRAMKKRYTKLLKKWRR